MADIKELEIKIKALMLQAKDCVDASIDLIREEPQSKKIIVKHWENFLLHFYEYVKAKEKASGEDILKGISLKKFIRFF